jgi:hypothetical protein
MNSNDLAPVIVMSVLSLSVATTLILRGPIGKALARWIESWGGTNAALLAEARSGEPHRLEEIEHRLAELEAREARVAELEERLDFAERLLTREAAARQLPGAGA